MTDLKGHMNRSALKIAWGSSFSPVERSVTSSLRSARCEAGTGGGPLMGVRGQPQGDGRLLAGGAGYRHVPGMRGRQYGRGTALPSIGATAVLHFHPIHDAVANICDDTVT